jgi:hypothetical protein
MLTGHDEVALILTVGVVHDDDHPAFVEVGGNGFNVVENFLHSAGIA